MMERAMTINPHPFVLTTATEQRRADLLNVVERERLARRAEGGAVPPQPWHRLSPARTAAGVLALLLTAIR
jgi:hypothetical protein